MENSRKHLMKPFCQQTQGRDCGVYTSHTIYIQINSILIFTFLITEKYKQKPLILQFHPGEENSLHEALMGLARLSACNSSLKSAQPK